MIQFKKNLLLKGATKKDAMTNSIVRFTLASLVVLSLAACSTSDYVSGDTTALRLAQRVHGVSVLERRHSGYDWQVIMWCTPSGRCPRVNPGADGKRYPVRVVCYCKANADSPLGWFIEVNLATNGARAISGNSVLERKYGFKRHAANPDAVGRSSSEM